MRPEASHHPVAGLRRPQHGRCLAVLVGCVVAMLLVAACSSSAGANSRGTAPRSSGAVRSTGGVAESGAHPSPAGGLDVRVDSWAVDDGVVFVKLTNHSGEQIRSARAVITTKDANGSFISAVSGPPAERCCTLVGVPPGGSYGVYATLGSAASRVRGVSVAFADVALGAGDGGTGQVTVQNARLLPGDADATVTATITPSGVSGPYVTALAYLNGPSGAFVAVIVGRYYCVTNGVAQSIRLELYHPVPAGTTLDSVVAYPVPVGSTGITSALPHC